MPEPGTSSFPAPRAYGSKIRERSFGGTPRPWSCTRTIARSSARSIFTAIRVPCGAYFVALGTSPATTSAVRRRSPRTKTACPARGPVSLCRRAIGATSRSAAVTVARRSKRVRRSESSGRSLRTPARIRSTSWSRRSTCDVASEMGCFEVPFLSASISRWPRITESGVRRSCVTAATEDERQHLVEIQGRGEDVRDLEERRDLAQLPVRFALEAAFLDDSRDLIRDRLQEIDLLAAEVALLDRLHVHHPDDLVAGEYGHGEHRGEALLVDLRHPLPARLTTYIAGGQGNTRVRNPADDPLSYPQRRAPDAPAVQPVRGDEAQQAVGPLEEIQR